MRTHILISWFICATLAAVSINRRSDNDPISETQSLATPDLILRGTMYWIGHFDSNGNFIPDPKYPAYSNPPATLIGGNLASFGGNRSVYEHRSGLLIAGTMLEKPYGVFVPDLGSSILDIRKFDRKKPDMIVWNMFDTVSAFWTSDRKKQFPNGLPRGKEPPKAGTPEGWKFIPFSQLETDLIGHKMPKGKPIKHARAIGDIVEFGHLSDEGEFVPDPDLPVVSRAGILGPMKFDRFSEPRYYTVPEPPWKRGPKRPGQTEDDPEPVYEFRSGRLIKGMLQKTGNFVPELGSKIMDFKDYDPISDRRRIYNLPGVLKRIEKK